MVSRRERSKCIRCGKCCREQGFELIATSGDIRRWRREGRIDILRYVWSPKMLGGYGDIWTDPETGEDLDYCPFLRRVAGVTTIKGRYRCDIYETRPKVCREFYCEYAYGDGKRGKAFKTARGWSERARELGYGQAERLGS